MRTLLPRSGLQAGRAGLLPVLRPPGRFLEDQVSKLRSTAEKLATASLRHILWICAPSAGLDATQDTHGWPVQQRHLLDMQQRAFRCVEGVSPSFTVIASFVT